MGPPVWGDVGSRVWPFGRRMAHDAHTETNMSETMEVTQTGETAGEASVQREARAIEPLPMVDGTRRVDWEAAGFEVLTRDPKDGSALTVAEKGKTFKGALILRVADIDKVRKYMPDECILGALDGSSFRVKQQAVCRAYLGSLTEKRAPAWDTNGQLVEPYRETMITRIWNSLNGIKMEREQTTRIVEKIVEVRVVVLPNGSEWKVDPKDETAPEMQLFSAWTDALMEDDEDMDPDDAFNSAKRKLDKGVFHKMLGIEVPQA
jgi:hypothetical protein